MNNKTKRTLIYTIVTILLVIAVLAPAGSILGNKYSDNNFLDRQNAREFYKLPKNTVDVLIGGNSQILSGSCSPGIYAKSGITAYTLGTCNQPVYASYYWLKEALNYQKPKVYLLEVSGLYGAVGDSYYVKAFSEMKTNINKFEAVRNVTDGILTDEFVAYFSDLYRYSSRWNELKKGDYAFIRGVEEQSYLGYAAIRQTYEGAENISYDSYPVKLSNTEKPFSQEENEIYVRKIVELCKQEGINVALFKTVKESWTDEEYTAVKNLADELGVKYFDMNVKENLDKLNIDFQHDFFDPDHLNYLGASKCVDAYIEFLKENFQLADHRKDSRYAEFDKKYAAYIDYCESIKNME